MKKNVSIELLGDRGLAAQGVSTNVDSQELLLNNTFTSGTAGAAPLYSGSPSVVNPANQAGGINVWDLDTQGPGNATRQWFWNDGTHAPFPTGATGNGVMQKDLQDKASTIRQNMTLGANVKYTLSMRFANYNRSGVMALRAHGRDGIGSTIGRNVVLADPSNNPPYGIGGNVNFPDFGYAGGCPNNSIGTSSNAGTWKEVTVSWIQSAATTNVFTITVADTTTIQIDWIKLSRIDMDQSLLVGTLDGANPEDFPLSLTYSINSPANIEARVGAYSKTFQIPATANNNQILKRMNIINSTHSDSALRFKTPCRISVDNLFSIEGLFKVQDVTRIKNKAISYSCVFFGDNLGWSSLLENRLLNEIEYPNSTGLKVCARDIIATWAADDATQVTEYDGTVSTNTSPIIYPVASYGPTNETGIWPNATMQLLREYWEFHNLTEWPSVVKEGCYFYAALNTSNTTPLPVMDWRPMLWVYPMVHWIFNNIGYQISSTFIESNEFKRLLYATPNANHADPDSRYNAYSNTNDFKSAAVISNANLRFGDEVDPTTDISAYFFWTGGAINAVQTGSFDMETIKLTDASCFQNTHDASTAIDNSGAFTFWTIGEAGYYEIDVSAFSFGMDGGNWSISATYSLLNNIASLDPGLGFQVLTVGEVSPWRDVAVELSGSFSTTCFASGSGNPNYPPGQQKTLPVPNTKFQGYFNKGDKLRLFGRVDWELNAIQTQSSSPVMPGMILNIDDINCWFNGTDKDGYLASPQTSAGTVRIELLNPSRLEYGSTYDLAKIIPPEHKQLDFIKGLAHSFNLQFQTNETNKTVSIEPYSEFYKPPRDAIDWTAKLDRSQEVVDSWIDSNFTRRLIFKYKTDDKDAMIKEVGTNNFDGVLDNYPYIQYLSDAVADGDTVFENPFFYGTYDFQHFLGGAVGGIPSAQNFYTAALWNTPYRDAKGFDFGPRLLLYTKQDFGVQNLPNTNSLYVNVNDYRGFKAQFWDTSDIDHYTKAWVGWADITATAPLFPPAPDFTIPPVYSGFGYRWAHAYCPQAALIDRWNFTNQFGLSYGNYDAQDNTFMWDGASFNNVLGAQGTGLGLYHRYYKSMMDNLIEQPKMRTAYIDLKSDDIINLDFSRPIYIDGVYFRLVKIVDYQPHLNTPTKVELHQYNPGQGAGIPQAPQWINPATVAGGGGSTPLPTNLVPNP